MEVGRVGEIEVCFVDVGGLGAAAGQAGVVDEDVDGREGGREGGDQVVHGRAVADIEAGDVDLDARPAFLGDLLAELVEGFETAGGEDEFERLGACPGEFEGDCAADAGAGPGHQDDFVVQTGPRHRGIVASGGMSCTLDLQMYARLLGWSDARATKAELPKIRIEAFLGKS